MTRPGAVLIVGTGALATLFAGRLAAAGVRVEILGSWAEGLAALNQNGAQLEGVGSFPVRACADPAECSQARDALVLVKSWQTERAARQLRECLAPDGLALSLQNGLGNEDVLAQALGPQRTARGVTTSGAVLLAPGVARPGGEGQVVLERDARLERLESMLTAANFQIQLVADTRKLVWGKLVASAAINPLTALLRLKNGHLLERGEARRLLGELARETASVAWALGVELPFDDPQAAVEQVIRQTASNSSSMLQDVLRGSRTEVDAINGAVIALGQANGVPTPVNRVVWSLVRALFP